MDTTLETLEGDRVRLTVSVDEAEFDTAVDAAFRKLAREVRLPGFRPGKAPRKILEARLGPGAGRHEALQTALPDYYGRAVAELEVDAIDAPEIQVTGGIDGGGITFDAVVPVRPRASVAGHGSLTVEIPVATATDEDVDGQVEMLRGQQATLQTVDRPAEDGDQVTIDIEGTHDGEPVDGLTATDYLYEVGGGAVVPEIDENLRGASAGEEVGFEATHPDGDGLLEFRIRVSEVQEKVLPEVDDEFARAASEFDTAEELLADLRSRIDGIKAGQAAMLVRDRVAMAVADLVEIEPPEALVESEIDGRIRDMALRLNSQGLDFERYLEAVGRDAQSLRDEFREAAELASRVDLGLRAVADAEGLEAEAGAVDAYLATLAAHTGSEVDAVAEMLAASGRMIEVRADLRKQAALEWVLERVQVVDEEGNAVDRTALEEAAAEAARPATVSDEAGAVEENGASVAEGGEGHGDGSGEPGEEEDG